MHCGRRRRAQDPRESRLVRRRDRALWRIRHSCMDFALCSGLTVEQLSKASDLACWNDYACHHGERHGLTEAPISYRLRVMARCRENNLYQARCIGMHDRHACRQAFFDVLNVDNFGFTGLVVIALSLVSQNAQNASALPGREAAEGNEAYDDLIYGYSTRIPKVIGGSE